MKPKILVMAIATVFLSVSTLEAFNGKTVIPVTSPLYSVVENLYHETGRAPPNNARPWTADEMAIAVSSIDPTALSTAGQQAYAFLKKKLTNPGVVFAEDQFSFDSSPAVTVEGYSHFPLHNTTDSAPEAYEWIYGYEERRPFLSIPLEFWYGDALYLTSELKAKEEYRTVTSPTTPDVAKNYLNVLSDDPNMRIDLYFPRSAVRG